MIRWSDRTFYVVLISAVVLNIVSISLAHVVTTEPWLWIPIIGYLASWVMVSMALLEVVRLSIERIGQWLGFSEERK